MMHSRGRVQSKLFVFVLAFLSATFGARAQSTPQPEIFRVGGGVTRPEIVTRTPPTYTDLARAAQLQGTVIFEVIIDERGSVTDVRILKNLPLGLGLQATQAVKTWKFRPARLEGRPVKVYYVLTVNFALDRSDDDIDLEWKIRTLADELQGEGLKEREAKLRRDFQETPEWPQVYANWCLGLVELGVFEASCFDGREIPVSDRYASLVRVSGYSWRRTFEEPDSERALQRIEVGLTAANVALGLRDEPFEALVFKTLLLGQKIERADAKAREAVAAEATEARRRALALRPRAEEEGLLPKQ